MDLKDMPLGEYCGGCSFSEDPYFGACEECRRVARMVVQEIGKKSAEKSPGETKASS